MIVVFGGTGTIGGEVLRALAAQGHAGDRRGPRPEPGGLPARAGADRGRGPREPASLSPAVRDADHVFVATPASERQVELETSLVDALAEAPGRPHLVKLAAGGYDAVPADQAIALAANHARIVEHIRARRVPHTVLAPSGFMSNLLMSAGTIREQGVLYASSGDGGLSWVDPADVGAVAAHVLTSDGHQGASYTVTGPEVLDHDAVAAKIAAVVGRDVRYADVPAEQYRQSLDAAGLPPWLANALNELQQLYRAHLAEVATDEVQKGTGRPPATLDDWLTRNRAAFA